VDCGELAIELGTDKGCGGGEGSGVVEEEWAWWRGEFEEEGGQCGGRGGRVEVVRSLGSELGRGGRKREGIRT
jgi:hypothetical protein